MIGIGVSWGANDRVILEGHFDHIVSSVAELRKIIRAIRVGLNWSGV